METVQCVMQQQTALLHGIIIFILRVKEGLVYVDNIQVKRSTVSHMRVFTPMNDKNQCIYTLYTVFILQMHSVLCSLSGHYNYEYQ